jgi:hypothetical protein
MKGFIVYDVCKIVRFTDAPCTITIIKYTVMRWAGHVARVEANR